MDWTKWAEFAAKHWLTVLFGGVSAAVAALWRQGQKQKKTQQAIQDGVKALLRDRILQMYAICKSKGYCSLQDRESLESMYAAYHGGLQGNGTVSGVFNTMMSMPYEKERKDET